MRNPYIVGRWLRGDDHYGRERLLQYLLDSTDPAMWVVGTRRMGKTSLLRQMEWMLERREGAELVPLFWDLQGSETKEDFDYEIFLAVEDETERFQQYGVDVDALYGQDAIRILRALQRALRRHNKRLLLLIDEGEALINLAKNDDQALARLRKAFQSGGMRTVITATKLLMQLNDLTRHWLTSPFLFGFSLVNLWSLDPDSSMDLVLQRQREIDVEVSQERVEQILMHTHRHPYLIQYLCYRLFETQDGKGVLREIREEDLRADHLLSGFFEIDFEYLAPTERQILLTVARRGIISEEDLVAALENESIEQISMFVYGMNKLGYLRQVFGQWTVGNEFLRRWTLENFQALAQNVRSDVSDFSVESLLVAGRKMELDYLRHEIPDLQKRLESLLAARSAYDSDVPLELSMEIQKLRRQLDEANLQIRSLASGSEEPALP